MVVGLAAAGGDLVSKMAAGAWLDDGPVHLGGGLSLRLVHNPGVAFGVGARLPSWALLGVTGVVAAVLALAAWRGSIGPAVAAGLVVGGAVANLLDRTTGGTVVDVFDIGWWPTFNVADICITIGALVMVVAGARPAEPVRGHEGTE